MLRNSVSHTIFQFLKFKNPDFLIKNVICKKICIVRINILNKLLFTNFLVENIF